MNLWFSNQILYFFPAEMEFVDRKNSVNLWCKSHSLCSFILNECFYRSMIPFQLYIHWTFANGFPDLFINVCIVSIWCCYCSFCSLWMFCRGIKIQIKNIKLHSFEAIKHPTDKNILLQSQSQYAKFNKVQSPGENNDEALNSRIYQYRLLLDRCLVDDVAFLGYEHTFFSVVKWKGKKE